MAIGARSFTRPFRDAPIKPFTRVGRGPGIHTPQRCGLWIAVRSLRSRPGMTTDRMPKITYIEHDGTAHTVDAEIGSTVMETALATTSPASSPNAAAPAPAPPAWCMWTRRGSRWSARRGRGGGQLDSAFEVKPTSRLSCQIKVTEELDGLIVRTPAYQGR